MAFDQVTGTALLALLAEGFEFLLKWCAEIPDVAFYAGGTASTIGD